MILFLKGEMERTIFCIKANAIKEKERPEECSQLNEPTRKATAAKHNAQPQTAYTLENKFGNDLIIDTIGIRVIDETEVWG